MSWVLRPAGARKSAPSTSAGSQRPDAHTGCARAHLSLLPVLALLAGAFSLFAPATAEARTTLLSTTLTVGAGGNEVGCGSNTGAACSAQLTTDSLTIGGKAYVINELVIRNWKTPHPDLRLGLTRKYPEAGQHDQLPGQLWVKLTLQVGGKSFNAIESDDLVEQSRVNSRVTWSNPGISWTSGQQVQVSLVIFDPPSVPRNVRGRAGENHVTLNWDAPSSWGSATTGRFHIEWKPTNEDPLKWSAVNRAGNTVDPYWLTEPNVFSFVLSGEQRLLGRANRFIGTHPTHPYQTRTHALHLRIRAVSAVGVFGDWVEVTPTPFRTVTLSASPNPVQEGSPVTVTATVSLPLSEEVSIPIAAASVAKEIRIAAGETTGTYVHIAGDAPAGGIKREQMVVENWRLKHMTPPIDLGDPYLVNVQVLDGNADPHRVSVSDAKGWEQLRYGRLCFEFTLNRAASHEIWVGYRTENGTAIAGQDYQGVVGSPVIPFAPGETRKRKCISIWDDNVEDSGETFSMVLVNPHGALLGRDRGTGTIYNHESTSLSALIVEGASAEDGPFTALDMGAFAPGTTAYGVTVPHGTTHVRLRPKASNSNLTITTGLDGKGKSPVSSGQAGPAVALAVGDNVLVVKTEFNGQHQTYRVTVTRQAAAAVAVSLSATPNPVGEGSPVTVTATLTAALLGDVTIPLSTRRDTSEEGDHGALASITVPAGFTSATGTLPTFEDDDGEDETFTLSLGSLPTGLTAGATSSVQVTITKQQSTGATTTDTSTTTSSSGVSTTASLSALIVEGASAEDGPFTALDMGAFAPATTAYGVTVPHGTTHVRLRPKASNSNLTITTGLDGKGESPVSSGQSGPAVALAVGDNVLVVKTEFNGQRQTYRVTVTRQAAAAVAVSLSATPNPVGEGSPVTVRATLTAALLEDVTIPLSTRRDTSEEGDHGALAAITVPAGFTSATGTLPTFEDDDGEDETFTLSLGSLPAGLTAGATSSVQVTITKQQSSGATTTDTSTTTPSSGVSPTASGPDGETLLVGFGQIAQTPPEVSITALDGSSTISEGEAARFRVSRTGSTTAPLSVNLEVRENQAEGQDFVAAGNEGNKTITIPAGQDSALYTVPTDNDDMDEANGSITVTVETGTGYTVSDNTAEVTVRDDDAPVAAPPTEEKRAWHVRFGRSVSQQVVDALQQRFSTTTPSGLQLTVAGETLTSDTPLQENHVLLSRLLGFERVSGQEVAQGSSFSFSPEGAGARLSFWGKGAFSSFNGVEDTITLTGDVTTALLGAEWNTQRWRAGAALSHSWGNGSYQGEGDGADGRISSTLTGIFPYGRYALTPRLGVWATAGYGWGNITLNPDGDAPEYNPATTLALGAVGMDGLLLDGGREGVTLTTTADALFLKTGSEAVVGLASSEGTITRLRLGLEATRPFPLSNGAALSPSLEVGLRQDSGDAETGFGMDLGAGLSWNDPERGVTATVKGRTLLSHGAEDFQDQGLALSFSWEPDSSNRGPSLSLSHAVGLPAEGGMAALLNPTAIEVLDEPHSSGERFEARLAYGFPFYNDRLTLTPSVATALSPSSRSYGLLWSLAPYDEHLVGEPWQLSLEGERQEHLSSSTVDHSLKLRFALPL